MMSVIVGPKHGHATLNGTAGDDTIVANGGYNTITGGGGNDTILAGAGGFATVMVGVAGDGLSTANDVITLFGASNLLTTGDENVTVTGHITASTLSIGNGTNLVDINGAGNIVRAGTGANTVIALGGDASVVFSGQAGTFGLDSVILSGIGNTVQANISVGPYPTSGIENITGGTGNGTFSMANGANGNIITGGTNNSISGGSGTIVAGSGFDTVLAGGQSNSVVLAGLGNNVGVTSDSAFISGGSGDGSFDLSGQYIGRLAGSGLAAPATYGPGAITLTTGGLDNAATLFDGIYQVNPGSGADTVQVIISTANVSFYGSEDELSLDGGQNTITVNDHSSGLDVVVAPRFGEIGLLTLDHFDHTGVVDFGTTGGFSSVEQIVSSLDETSAGTYTLATLDNTGTITFAGVAPLTVANFKL